MPKKPKKFNLTVIDQIPEVTNFVYRGISEEDKARIVTEFHDWKKEGRGTLQFSYDEGEAHLKISNIHSMVFSDYMSVEDEDDAQNAREDD